MGHMTKVMMLSISIFLSEVISGVSFNFIPCVELEIPGGVNPSPEAASGIIRDKLGEGFKFN